MAKTKFYQDVSWFLMLGFIVILIGFYNSYFTRLGETSFPYHLHGISASLWMVILVLQPILYKSNKLKLHKYLGWSTVALVALIIYGGETMMKLMIQNQDNYPPNTVYKLAFIDALTLFGFLVLYILAIIYRKNVKLHARFMVCTIFGPLIPALTRVYFTLGVANNFSTALNYSYLLIEVVLLVIIILERNFKEVRYTYLPVLVYMVVQHILMRFAGSWEWWISIMNNFSNYNQ